jgi:hypothetical protein
MSKLRDLLRRTPNTQGAAHTEVDSSCFYDTTSAVFVSPTEPDWLHNLKQRMASVMKQTPVVQAMNQLLANYICMPKLLAELPSDTRDYLGPHAEIEKASEWYKNAQLPPNYIDSILPASITIFKEALLRTCSLSYFASTLCTQ